jgi:crotonobetainyl-CoA:carnitine CoA-transferase CaiB-like acyl-CoA transferase
LTQPLLATQRDKPPTPQGNRSDSHLLHGAWRCAGNDEWIALAVANREQQRSLLDLLGDEPLEAWLAQRTAADAEATLLRAGVPAAALASSTDLVASKHLRARGFWDGGLPGMPWRTGFGRRSGPAPGLGADTDAVLAEILGFRETEIAALRAKGALG